MKELITENFLLKSPLAQRLFHEHAAGVPVIDFHCHLDPADLAADRTYDNIGQLWVSSDPYKHRAMRIAGVPENCITGQVSDEEKFGHWAATLPQTLGNPLYHWSALELKRYFGVREPLTSTTASTIWSACNHRLRQPEFTARGLLTQQKVACVCTSDRLLDDLTPHATLRTSSFATRVLPSLRGDDILAIESSDFVGWVKRLSEAAGMTIGSYSQFCDAVARRLDAFQALDCRLADHALDDFRYTRVNASELAGLFERLLAGEKLEAADSRALQSGMLRDVAAHYGRRGWILQLHLGAQRTTSTRLRKLAGPAGGFASVGNAVHIPSLCAFLDDLEQAGALPRTILYPLNSADFASLAVLSGSFAEDRVRGKVQLGPAWWFNDHITGMRAQLDAVASHSLLSVSIGMTTDSRSLLSMTRHEYFRRVLCDWIGDQVASGNLPDNFGQLGGLIRAVIHDNAHAALSL